MRSLNILQTWSRFPLAVGVLMGLSALPARAAEPFYPVQFDSLYTKGLFSSEPLKITGYVLEAGTGGKTPGAVLAPACGGLMKSDQLIWPWYRFMANHLRRLGITTVLVDGFNPRGQTEICSQNPNSRTIDLQMRMKDSLAGLRYLRGRSDIDGDKVFLFTWGAAGSFRTMNKDESEVAKIGGGFTAAVMFYPMCEYVDTPISPYAPIQVFIGEEDAWNPPGPCISLAKKKAPGSAPLDIKIYPDSYHGFDLPGPPRKRENVNAKVGTVMVGGNPVARQDAYRRTAAFLSRFTGKGTEGRGGKKKKIFSEAKIRETVIGNTLSFKAPSNGKPFLIYFGEDGRVAAKVARPGKPVVNKRWFIKNGKFLCRTYGRKDKNHCTFVGATPEPGTLLMFSKKVRYKAKLLKGRQLSQ